MLTLYLNLVSQVLFSFSDYKYGTVGFGTSNSGNGKRQFNIMVRWMDLIHLFMNLILKEIWIATARIKSLRKLRISTKGLIEL